MVNWKKKETKFSKINKTKINQTRHKIQNFAKMKTKIIEKIFTKQNCGVTLFLYTLSNFKYIQKHINKKLN